MTTSLDPGPRDATEVPGIGVDGDQPASAVGPAAVDKAHDAAERSDDPAVDPATDAVVDGQQLLADLEAFVRQYAVFPASQCLDALCLWIIHTWALPAFYVTPRLILDSPEPGCGKSRVLELLALLCRDARMTFSTTQAALFRSIEAAGDHPPTILHDEADTVFGRSVRQADDLRALYNSGYKRGATVDRCHGSGATGTVQRSPVFAPVALAGLAGKMPSTITSRAITIHMRRRAPSETVKPHRQRIVAAEAAPLRARLQAWAEQNLSVLMEADSAIPDGVEDRPAEVWEALLMIADLIGGNVPDRARAACCHFVFGTNTTGTTSLGVRLLTATRVLFGDADRMFSDDLVTKLAADPESEWADLPGGPLTQRRLAKALQPYGVRSQEIRIGSAHRKGYIVAGDTGLAQVWDRYLPILNAHADRTGDEAHQAARRDDVACPGQALECDRNATTELPVDQQFDESVADVADVADKNDIPARSALNHDRSSRDPEPAPPAIIDMAAEATAGALHGLFDGRPQPPGGLRPDSPGQTPLVMQITERLNREAAALVNVQDI